MPEAEAATSSTRESTFLLVPGAQKAGTTWLYHTLRRQAGVHFPTKEAHVFDRAFVPALSDLIDRRRAGRIAGLAPVDGESDRAAARRLAKLRLEHRYVEAATDFAVYAAIYAEILAASPVPIVTGDMTPDYSLLTSEQWRIVRQVVDQIPGRKRVLLLLRDPVERMISELRFAIRTGYAGIEPGERVDEGSIMAVLSRPEVDGHSAYEHIMPNIESVFARDEVHIEFYEGLFHDDAMARLAQFLGIGPIDADFARIDNPSGVVLEIPPLVRATLRERFDETYRWARDRFGQERIDGLWQ